MDSLKRGLGTGCGEGDNPGSGRGGVHHILYTFGNGLNPGKGNGDGYGYTEEGDGGGEGWDCLLLLCEDMTALGARAVNLIVRMQPP